MPNPRKLFVPMTLQMVTFRTEEGLPFLPLGFINEIIWSTLGKAYELYKVKVCAVSAEPNHFHLLILVEDPEKVSPFIGYLKQETAHAINRLLGRRKKTVWCEGFDSPTILDSKEALERFAYVLLNPVKDQLVSNILEYEGINSYSMLVEDRQVVSSRRIFRDSILQLKNPEQAWLEESTYQFDLVGRESNVEFKLFPYSWKQCFEDTKQLSDQEIRRLMLATIEAENERLTKVALNPQRLKRQSLLMPYVPRAHGKRMICLSSFKSLRIQFIAGYKALCKRAKEVFNDWGSGKLTAFPAGMFPPSQPRYSNFIPKFAFG